MTRAAAWLALTLGLLALWNGADDLATGNLSPATRFDVAGGALAFLGFLLWRRGRPQGRWFYLVGGLVVLATHLPLYFRGPALWPHLTLIAMGTLTFGFGLLGLFMDGVTRPPRGASGEGG